MFWNILKYILTYILTYYVKKCLDFDGIDDCCKEQFRRFEAGEELEEDEADELEECCAETLEGLNRYGSQYFKILQFRNQYGMLQLEIIMTRFF